MTELTLIFPVRDDDETLAGSLTLDATLNEETKLTCPVTKYPVEEGAKVSDNIGEGEEELSIDGVVTGAGVLAIGAGGRSKLIAAKAALRAIAAGRTPVTIITGMDVYESMGMTDARIVRNGPLEKVGVSMSFTKIRMATVREADVPQRLVKGDKGDGANGRAGATKSPGGKSQPQETAPAAKEQSVLRSMTKGDKSVSEVLGL